MPEIKTRHIFTITLQAGAQQSLGTCPTGERRPVPVLGGRFEGERLRGTVLEGGSDWITVRSDGVWVLDVRLVLQTEDGARIGMTYRGLRHGPADIMEKVGRGETVDPNSYYFRSSVVFETSAAQYAWLNKVIAVGFGQRKAEGPFYDVYEIL
jgi:hypothetical protein